MKEITEIEFQKTVKPIYEAVFANEDPYRNPMQPNMQPRLLLYPFRYGLLKREPWLKPITKAIRALGENGFYLTLLGTPGEEPWHWHVPLSEAETYIESIFPRENAIFSVNGRWGVICSEEDHAVVGGSQLLIDTIRESTSDMTDRLKMFLTTWKELHTQNNEINIDWIPTLLSHVYGTEFARIQLKDTGLEI